MVNLLSGIALLLIILATCGFIGYIVKQQKKIFKWSYTILFVGFIFHTLSIGYQYYTLGAVPVISLKSALSFFSWCIIGVYLIFQLRFGLMVLGSFLIPLAAVLMTISYAMPGVEMTIKPLLQSIWLPIHVCALFIGDGMFAVTFIAAIMYLIQERQIKRKTHGSFYSRLPSLETLDSINHFSLKCGFPLLTLGLITGVIYAHYALGSYWQWDQKEVWSLITWLFYAVLLHERLVLGWRGRRAALMSIACFLVLLFTFIVGSLWLSDYHSFRSLQDRAGL
ncbi:MAG: cytochrome c biogenesis protein CcsA [Deltaproteobacteria bacterium]|nr:cytochrome c biogenesis protein CcsA [Deltaproteobacteria bacterium]